MLQGMCRACVTTGKGLQIVMTIIRDIDLVRDTTNTVLSLSEGIQLLPVLASTVSALARWFDWRFWPVWQSDNDWLLTCVVFGDSDVCGRCMEEREDTC